MALTLIDTRRPKTRMLMRIGRIDGLLPVAIVILCVAAWELAVVLLHVPEFVLPRPSKVATALFTEAPLLMPSALATAQAIALGFLVAVAVAIPLATVLAESKWIEKAIFPLVVGAQIVPKVALAPLLTVWLGLGLETKVTVAFLLSFFPILIDTMVGLKSVETGKIHVARSMGATAAMTFFRIKLPSALPFVFSGLKVASTLAVAGAIVGEFIGARAGLGNVLLVSNGNFDTVTMFAAIVYLTALGMLLFFAIDLLERTVIPWHISKRGSERGAKH